MVEAVSTTPEQRRRRLPEILGILGLAATIAIGIYAWEARDSLQANLTNHAKHKKHRLPGKWKGHEQPEPPVPPVNISYDPTAYERFRELT